MPVSPAPHVPGAPSTAQATDADHDAIKATALDYIEGYLHGNAERMRRALHPKLAKRVLQTDQPSGCSRLQDMNALELVERTRARAGSPTTDRVDAVTVLDVFGNAANAMIASSGWVDYLHLSKLDGRWVIVNVLWEPKAIAR